MVLGRALLAGLDRVAVIDVCAPAARDACLESLEIEKLASAIGLEYGGKVAKRPLAASST